MYNFDRLILYALIGFLAVFLSTIFIQDAHEARGLLAIYSFIMVALYVVRSVRFKEPIDKVATIGFCVIGVFFGIGG